MSTPIRALVAVDGVIDPRRIEAVLDDPGIDVVGVTEQEADVPDADATPADVPLVACGKHPRRPSRSSLRRDAIAATSLPDPADDFHRRAGSADA